MGLPENNYRTAVLGGFEITSIEAKNKAKLVRAIWLLLEMENTQHAQAVAIFSLYNFKIEAPRQNTLPFCLTC